MSNIKTWQERSIDRNNAAHCMTAMQSEITNLRTALAERDAELTKAQDELNCTEVELEAAACNLPDDKFNQGFECMGDFVRAVSEGYKAQLAERDAELLQAKASAAIWHERHTAACTLNKDDAAKRRAEIVGLEDELATLRAAAQQALEAINAFQLTEDAIMAAQAGCLILRVPMTTIQLQATAQNTLTAALERK